VQVCGKIECGRLVKRKCFEGGPGGSERLPLEQVKAWQDNSGQHLRLPPSGPPARLDGFTWLLSCSIVPRLPGGACSGRPTRGCPLFAARTAREPHGSPSQQAAPQLVASLTTSLVCYGMLWYTGPMTGPHRCLFCHFGTFGCHTSHATKPGRQQDLAREPCRVGANHGES
jgi:hypothetical protein